LRLSKNKKIKWYLFHHSFSRSDANFSLLSRFDPFRKGYKWRHWYLCNMTIKTVICKFFDLWIWIWVHLYLCICVLVLVCVCVSVWPFQFRTAPSFIYCWCCITRQAGLGHLYCCRQTKQEIEMSKCFFFKTIWLCFAFYLKYALLFNVCNGLFLYKKLYIERVWYLHL